MSNVNSDNEIYSLKSLFKNGSVTIKPYFKKKGNQNRFGI